MSQPSNPDTVHAEVAATPARQGRYGKPVFWVLIVSTAFAAIALFTAWGLYAPALHSASDKVSETRAAHATDFSAPETAPATSPAR